MTLDPYQRIGMIMSHDLIDSNFQILGGGGIEGRGRGMGRSRSSSSSSPSVEERSYFVTSKRARREERGEGNVAGEVEVKGDGGSAQEGQRGGGGRDEGDRKEKKREKKKNKAEKKEKKAARHGRKLLSEVADGMMLKVDKRLLKVCRTNLLHLSRPSPISTLSAQFFEC